MVGKSTRSRPVCTSLGWQPRRSRVLLARPAHGSCRRRARPLKRDSNSAPSQGQSYPAGQSIAFPARPLASPATFLHTGRPCASRMSFMPVTPSRIAPAEHGVPLELGATSNYSHLRRAGSWCRRSLHDLPSHLLHRHAPDRSRRACAGRLPQVGAAASLTRSLASRIRSIMAMSTAPRLRALAARSSQPPVPIVVCSPSS